MIEEIKFLEKEAIKREIISIVGVLILLLTVIGFFIAGIINYYNFHKNAKTPLGWCLWEIHKHEDYDCDWAYVCYDVDNYDDFLNPDVKCYYITCFLDDRQGEWFCYIECYHSLPFDNAVGYKEYNENEVLNIDCDLVREVYYEIH